jgi:hypothetical protein
MTILDQYLMSIPASHHELVQLLDSVIMQAAPMLTSSLKWSNLTYGTSRNICAIVTHKNHVNLQFFEGAHLNDPGSVLTGTGKDMRHIKLVGVSDVDTEYIALLLRQQV